MNSQKTQTLMSQSAGFTLTEVMVSLAIVSLIVAALGTMFARSGRLYTTQNAAAALQQETRAALEIIAQEARMAAYRPDRNGDKAEIKVAKATHFRFQADLDGSGKVDKSYNSSGECENRSFRFSAANNSIQMICGEGTGSMDSQVLIGDTEIRVTALDFDYYNDSNNSTSFISDIRGAVVTVVAQAPAGSDGMIRRSYSTRIDFRNTGPNAKN